MSGRRGENPSVVTGIGGLDAEEFFIAFVREVGERSRLFFPRIPDHCGEGVLFCDSNLALPLRIVEGERVAGAEVNAVGFIGDTKDVFALSGVGFRSSSGVDVGGVLEAFELDFAGIRGRQVRVKGASDSLIFRRKIGGPKGDGAGFAEVENGLELIGKGDVFLYLGGFWEGQDDFDFSGSLCAGGELPKAIASDTVGRILVGGRGMGVEPGPAQGDASTNGLPFFKNGGGGGVENGVGSVTRLPLHQVGSMEREDGAALLGVDLENRVVVGNLGFDNSGG